jgi:AraC-like DNA-binding protein
MAAVGPTKSRLDTIRDWEARAKRAGFRVSLLPSDCGVSRRQLHRFFLLKFHEPPRRWLAEQQLREAANDLTHGLLAKEAMSRTGFKTAAHFARAFKRFYQVPPTVFRTGSPPEP